jgi:hypothetical protein
MMHSAEPRRRNDPAEILRANPVVGYSLPEFGMGAVLVVVAHVFREQPLEMLFIHCNDVIQQTTAAALG